MLRDFFWNISSRKILWISAAGLCLSLVLSFAVSKRLARAVSGEVRARELEFTFGAIEAGPLAIARLQSASIAQQELQRLMSNPKLAGRGMVSAQIRGGADLSFVYAQWTAPLSETAVCPHALVRTFNYDDALNPFQVTVVRDDCFVLAEERAILTYSSVASLLVAVISALLLAASAWPAAASVRRAESFLKSGASGQPAPIPFLPIRSLVHQALRNMEAERDAALSRIAAQVSHDIRSPLTALRMVTSTLGDVPEEKRKMIDSAAERISSVASQLLQMDKQNRHPAAPSAGTPAPQIPPVFLAEAIREIVTEKRVQLQDRPRIRLDLDLPAGLNPAVRIDSGHLARALSNLVNNAIEAVEPSGKVTVGLREGGGCAQILVVDDGNGIPPEILGRLGQRGASFGKSSGDSGSGLGLYHARETAEAAGGALHIQSKLGAGTLIRIDLPTSS